MSYRTILIAALLALPTVRANAETVQPAPAVHMGPRVQSQQLPDSPEYWDFQRWYVDHAVVSLFVSGANPDHLTSVLNRIAALKSKGVLLGPIVVIGGSSFTQLDNTDGKNMKAISTIAEIAKHIPPEHRAELRQQINQTLLDAERVASTAQTLDLRLEEPASDIRPVLDHLHITYSPTWIVRQHGQDYVYEGVDSIDDLFDSGGQFRAPKQ